MDYLGPRSQVSRAGLPPAAPYSARFGCRLGRSGRTCHRDPTDCTSGAGSLQHEMFLGAAPTVCWSGGTPIAQDLAMADEDNHWQRTRYGLLFPNMAAVLASVIAVLGTLGGTITGYIF